MATQPNPTRVVLVTGPSGAGRSTAINVLEDLGFEAIDNIPLRMISRLFEEDPPGHPLALGIDVRNRDFSLDRLLDLHTDMVSQTEGNATLLYLDCRPDVLLRRYSETRRRHPLAQSETPEIGIAREIELLQPIEERADILIDTSNLSPHDLKAQLHQWFADASSQKLSVAVQSFSFKRGIPHGADMVFDCRFLANPHWEPSLRELTGLDESVRTFVAADGRAQPFLEKIGDMLGFLLPEVDREGKTHLSVAIGCTGGQHRSVVVAEHVARTLAEQGWRVSIGHKELARRGIAPAGGVVLSDLGGTGE
ncbi:MAG: RNase adapter RapZ [Marivita sp.]|uniref:RNase adapter RapZ n=1 Tax=Marivita sp. TaxID=2003365 RepID=UPI0025C06030|nr:RNase adapter RapZ [Marivita sp.]MCI5111678.1 RNase adapter RapZ [Marivita sp.]